MLRIVSEIPILNQESPLRESKELFGLNQSQLGELVKALGQPRFRARQLADALYRQRVTEISQITNLSLELRNQLIDAGWSIARPKIDRVFTSSDATERYLIECSDGQSVETVWMPESDESDLADSDELENASAEPANASFRRATLCVSSQVGCAVNCQFCLTARLGWSRNLTPGEIAGQIVAALDRHQVSLATQRINIVFMGMGEPFLNYANFSAALRLLVDEVGLSPRRMTVSTAGILTGIERYAAEPEAYRPRLAISLNAPSDEIRAQVMPINRKWPIDQIFAALRQIPLRPGERITFEYVLLGGVNDSESDARTLAKLLRRLNLPVKVNLIPWNPGPGPGFASPADEQVARFKERLIQGGIPAYQRRPRGRDIYAACGQLKRTLEG